MQQGLFTLWIPPWLHLQTLFFPWIFKDQEKCTDSGFKTLENKNKPIFFKELKKLRIFFGVKYSASNILLIDDKPYKALLNPVRDNIIRDVLDFTVARIFYLFLFIYCAAFYSNISGWRIQGRSN